MLFQTWLDLLLVKQLPNRKGRRPGTKPRDKPVGLSLYSIPTHDMLSLNQSFQTTLQKWWSYDGASRRDQTAPLNLAYATSC
jgi:hypothetical protein